MLAHSLATDPSRTLRCPITSRVSTAPLGLVSSLSFNRGCKEKSKVFINVDRYGVLHFLWLQPLCKSFPLVPALRNTISHPKCRYTKYSTPFCYSQRNARITPLATASFGDMADSSTREYFPTISVTGESYIISSFTWDGVAFFYMEDQ